MKRLCLLVACCVSVNTYAETKTVTYEDQINKHIHTVTYDCKDFAIPRVYECSRQEITFSDGHRYSPSVERHADGYYNFWISGLGYIATANHDIYKVVEYLDTSGSRTRAEERFEMLEYTGDGAIRSKYGALSYEEFQNRLKTMDITMNVKFVPTGGL